MYHRYNGLTDWWQSTCATEVIWIIDLLSLCSVVSHVFPLAASKEMEIVKKEGGLPLFHNDNLKIFFANC